MAAVLHLCDWGSSRLRAWNLDQTGEVVRTPRSGSGSIA
jgi:2-keto-3-deoxy-galactonokinase